MNIVIRFLLRDGHGLDAYVTKQRAKEIIDTWEKHQLKGYLCGEDLQGYWSVDMSQVMAIRTVVPQGNQVSPEGAMRSLGRSGIA